MKRHQIAWTKKQQEALRRALRAQSAGKGRVAYYCTDQFGRPANGGSGLTAAPLTTQKIKGPLAICSNGLHATLEPHRWRGCRVWVVALLGEYQQQGDKFAALRRQIIGEILPEDALFSAPVRARLGYGICYDDNLSRANLSGADLSAASLSGADLSAADLYAANLSGADLSAADLSAANLSAANLSRADLSAANLSGADLSGADLSAADLSAANLSRADLSAANLSGADLSGADLSAADLSAANLSAADLSGAGLSAADLYAANLSGANLYVAYRPNDPPPDWYPDGEGYLRNKPEGGQ